MKTTKWVTVAIPIADHRVLEAEAHRLSIDADERTTFADIVKTGLHEKAERIRSEQALRRGESPDNVLHSALHKLFMEQHEYDWAHATNAQAMIHQCVDEQTEVMHDHLVFHGVQS